MLDLSTESSAAVSRRRAFSVFLAFALSFPPLVAAEPSIDCDAHTIRLSAPLAPMWRDELATVCQRLTERQDVDPSVELEIEPTPAPGLTIRATLADGRVATRFVDSPGSLSRTLEALLVLPPVIAPKPRDSDGPSRGARRVNRQADPPSGQEGWLHFGIGVSAIGELFFPPPYAAAGFAARASLRIGSFLLDVTPRWEVEQATVHSGLLDFEMHQLGIGVALGARVYRFDEGVLEGGLGILILEETQSERESGKEIDASRLGAQLLGHARFSWGGPTLRGALGIEASLSPSRLAHAVHLRDILPALPPFGIGIVFGVHWESE